MATKSIYSNVVIKSPRLCRGLISALESSENKKRKTTISKKVIRVEKNKIKDLIEKGNK